MSQDKYSLWEDLARKTARWVARDFPEVEESDLFQDLMLWILETDALTNPDEEYMAVNLGRKATAFAWEYRKQGLYVSAQYAYRISDIRRILETVFQYEEWSHSYLPEDAASESDDDRMIVSADVKAAYDRLSEPGRDIIYSRYALRMVPGTENDRKKLSRAIETLTDNLNFYKAGEDHVGPGARGVISNTYANHLIQDD